MFEQGRANYERDKALVIPYISKYFLLSSNPPQNTKTNIVTALGRIET